MFKDLYIQRKSAIHELDFWVKLISFLLVLPLVSFLAESPLLIFLSIVLVVLVVTSKIGPVRFWRNTKSYLVPITVGLLVLSVAFSPGGFDERLIGGLALSVRFGLLISFGMLFSMVTNPIEIPAGFLRARLPHKYGVTLMVGYRMMPLLSEKITTIVQAQKARGASFRFSPKAPKRFFMQIGSLAIPLLHATLSMSVRLSDALISRGYDPDGIITLPTKRWRILDFGFVVFSVLLLVWSVLI